MHEEAILSRPSTAMEPLPALLSLMLRKKDGGVTAVQRVTAEFG